MALSLMIYIQILKCTIISNKINAYKIEEELAPQDQKPPPSKYFSLIRQEVNLLLLSFMAIRVRNQIIMLTVLNPFYEAL